MSTKASIPEKVKAGKMAKDVFDFACREADDCADAWPHFWERLGQLVNTKLPNATTAPASDRITNAESREIGQLRIDRGNTHRGKKIDDAPLDYLEWAADNWSDSLGQKIRLYLESPRIKYERLHEIRPTR